MCEEAILADYKSFVVVLTRCPACGVTPERKENEHHPSEQPPWSRPVVGPGAN